MCRAVEDGSLQVRLQVAAHLWHLVFVRAELLQHLTALKSYFLLARGDFYQAFLSEV